MDKKIIDFKMPLEHYKNAPCLIWCFDDRLHELREKFRELLTKNAGITHIDEVMLAGGAKDLASPDKEHKLQALLEEIEASLKLHKAPWLGLMVHADCGAYGKKFRTDLEETTFYELELKKAKKVAESFLKEKELEIPVKLYYADFRGLYEL